MTRVFRSTNRVGVEQLPLLPLVSRRRPSVAQPLRTPRIPRLLAATTLTLVLAPLLLTACGDGGSSASDNGKIRVVTTLPLFADFVRNVGGDRVEVTSLLPLGADPHTFEPTPGDVEPITKADIAFANGLDLEPGLLKVLEANLPTGKELVKLAEEEPPQPAGGASPSGPTGIGIGAFEQVIYGSDPHLWMDTTLALRYVGVIQRKLNALEPTSQASYQDNYTRYESAISDLRSYITRKVAQIPPDNRKLVTAHEAFDWFAGSLGLKAVAAVAESPGNDPSPNEIADLTAAIKDQHIPAVFSEPQINEESRILKQAADDAGVQVCMLYSDSLDEKITNYIDMMRFNADELARCLGGQGGG